MTPIKFIVAMTVLALLISMLSRAASPRERSRRRKPEPLD